MGAVTETKRLQFVDMVKGIAILCVVSVHLVAPSLFRSGIDHIMEIMLAAFFFFSGYFYRPGKKKIGENLKARAKALLIPFFKYSLFFWGVGTLYLVSSGGAPINEALCCLRNFYGGCIWNRTIQNWFGWEYYSLGKRYFFLADFWFLIAMMLASIVFFIIVDRVIYSRLRTLIAVAALFAVTGILRGFAIDLPYNLQLVPFWTAFMLLGALAGNFCLFEIEALQGKKEWLFGLIALAGGVAIALVFPANSNIFRGSFAENEVLSMLLSIVASILGVWGLGILCKKIEAKGIRVKELAWLGSHSLLIYLYHMFFAWIISIITGFSVMYPEEPDVKTLLLSILMTVACFTLCILRYVLGDIITGKLSKNPAAWGKVRTVVCAVVLGAIALGSAFMGYRSAELGPKAELELNKKIHAADLDGLFTANDVKDTIYVTGHQNPDTDAVCSSILCANLLTALGHDATPVVLGNLNNETKYVLEQAGIDEPEVLDSAAGKYFFLVDHSDYLQSAEGMDTATILGVVDHHGIGDISTANQVIYDAKPLGSTGTVLWLQYRDYGLTVDRDMARLIISAIMSETQNLTTSSVTEADQQAVKTLQKTAGILETEEYWNEMFKASVSHEGASNEDILHNDWKQYEAGDVKYSISVAECFDEDEVKEMAGRMKKVLPDSLAADGVDYAYAEVYASHDDVSVCYIVPADKGSEDAFRKAFGEKAEFDGNYFIMNTVISRDGELVPELTKVFEEQAQEQEQE